jgi:hypothetical protein
MKKIIGILIFVMMCGVISAQVSKPNWYRYLLAANGGLKIGNTVEKSTDNKVGSLLLLVDSVTTNNVTNPTVFKLWRNGVEITPSIPAGGQIDGATFYSKLQPDTVQHTSNYTVSASDWGKDQHLNKATSILVTLPTNLAEWPIGGVMNFYGMGAGIMVFSGGTIISDKDSIATSRKGQAVVVKKIAASKYILIGPLTD